MRLVRLLAALLFALMAVSIPAFAQYQLSADLNGDGRPDIVTAQGVHMNQGGALAPLASFGLAGTRSLVAVGDFNGDGKADVAVAGPDLVVLLGEGNGSFQAPVSPIVPLTIKSLAAADFNGDGKADLVVSDSSAQIIGVLLSSGNGTFLLGNSYLSLAVWDPSFPDQPYFLVTGDVDRDGNEDFVISSFNGLVLYAGLGDGSFTPVVIDGSSYPSQETFALGDFNEDGRLDVIRKLNKNEGEGPWFALCLNLGNRVFRAKIERVATGNGFTTVGDFNGDGHLDFAMDADSDSLSSIGLGNGDGTFRITTYVQYGLGAHTGVDIDGDGQSELVSGDAVLRFDEQGRLDIPINYPVGEYPHFMAIGDLTGDSKPDIIVSNHWDGVFLLQNQGDGLFSKAMMLFPEPGISVAIGDFNGDGKQDVATAGSQQLSWRQGNGDGTLQSQIPISAFPYEVPLLYSGDLNGDGNLDLILVDDPDSSDQFGPIAFLGNGDGTFQPPIIPNQDKVQEIVGASQAVDWDRDGHLDDVNTIPIPRLLGELRQTITADVNSDGVKDVIILANGFFTESWSQVGIEVAINRNPAGNSTHFSSFTSSAASVLVGQSVTFSWQVAADVGVPTGAVKLFDGSTLLGEVALDSTASGSFTTSSLGVGAHTIHAVYAGQGNFVGSDANMSVTIKNPTKLATTTTLAATDLDPQVGQQVTLIAAVVSSGATPTGTVIFTSQTGAVLGTVTLNASGQATLTLSFAKPGAQKVVATYARNANFLGSASGSVMMMVKPAKGK